MDGDQREIMGREPPEFKVSPPSHQEPEPQLPARAHSLQTVGDLPTRQRETRRSTELVTQ